MAGTFELFTDGHDSYGFRLKAPDGAVVMESRTFPDKVSAVHGIRAAREYAAMGLITDRCTGGEANRAA